jgi:hypothetical protein
MVNSCTPGAPQTEGPFGNATCSDGLDNDCDGSTDAADINCGSMSQLPDMSQWAGEWFVLTKTTKQTVFSESDSRFITEKNVSKGYMYIWKWNSDDQELLFDYYQFDEEKDEWNIETNALYFIAGTDKEFSFRYNKNYENSMTVFTGIVKGNVKNGNLKGATFKTSGGFYAEVDNDNAIFSAGEQIVTGQIIKASKVPVWTNVLIQR